MQSEQLIEGFKPWLEARLLEVSKTSGLGKTIRYAHWEGLTRFIDDRPIEIDSEREKLSVRGAVRAARNLGHSLIAHHSAKLHDIDLRHYLTHFLERIVSGRTKIDQLDMFLPWNWEAVRDGSEAKVAA